MLLRVCVCVTVLYGKARASVKYPRGHHRQRLNFRKQVDYIRQNTDRKINLLKVLNSLSDVKASILKNIYTATMQSTLEYGAVTFEMMALAT